MSAYSSIAMDLATASVYLNKINLEYDWFFKDVTFLNTGQRHPLVSAMQGRVGPAI